MVAVALYADGSPNEADAPKDFAMMETDNPVLVSTRNKAPVFPDQDMELEGRQTAQERTVAENTEPGMPIGDAVMAIDEDTNLTYSLGGPHAASFDIVRGLGATADQSRSRQRDEGYLHGNRDGYGLTE